MAETLNTFGLSVVVCQARWPMARLDDTSKLTPALLETLWKQAAARVCAALLRAKPTLDLSEITEAGSVVTWLACQDTVLDLMAPRVEMALNRSNMEGVKELQKVADTSLKRLVESADMQGPAVADAAPGAAVSYADDVLPAERRTEVKSQWAGNLKW